MGGREGGEGRFGENKAALNLKKTAHYISSHNMHSAHFLTSQAVVSRFKILLSAKDPLTYNSNPLKAI